MKILAVNGISKSFDDKKIIDNLSFEVESGKIVGLLGKNGCGKTTILKMINDLLTVDSGEILIDGQKIGPKTKEIVSYLPERTYLEKDYTINQTFMLFQDFYKDFDKARAEELLKELDLSINMRLSKMSKGMQEKLQLILVMSRRAKLYILDEPLGGVDPATRDYILKTILSNFDKGASMLITTHLVSEVENILDEVIFIDKGRAVLTGNVNKLRQKENSSINDIFKRVLKC